MGKRGRLSRHVLSDRFFDQDTATDAAWDLLMAVQEDFPNEFGELVSLHALGEQERDQKVRAWITRHRVAGPAVEEIASEIAAGNLDPPQQLSVTLHANEAGTLIDPPAITAIPIDETLNEFRQRAAKHYQEVVNWYRQRGYYARKVKHDSTHFRYLAAHLIGGFSWAEIADGRVPSLRGLHAVSQKTVAGEARKVA